MRMIVLLIAVVMAAWPVGAGSAPAAESADAGYRRALPGYDFAFPRDHGAHHDFRTEWWYFTGNVTAEGGERFGFQLTFFRNRLAPPGAAAEAASPLVPVEVHLTHFAISNLDEREHRSWQRLGRPGMAQASAATATMDVAHGDWRAWMEPGSETMRLVAADGDDGIDLTLVPERPFVIHGRDGVHQKAGDAGQASHYISFTRLTTSGTVRWGGRAFRVEGLSWKDHEFGSDALSEEEVGWDWFALQLEGGEDLMVYQLRRRDGTANPFSSGSLVLPGGRKVELGKGEYSIRSLRTWKSPHTGATYPLDWEIDLPGRGKLEVRVAFDDQEMLKQRSSGVVYWEGAVTVTGTLDGRAAQGRGYVELVGYAAPFTQLTSNQGPRAPAEPVRR